LSQLSPKKRWQKERNEAEVLRNGCRVYRQTHPSRNGTEFYSAFFFSPRGERPLWKQAFSTSDECEFAIAKATADEDEAIERRDREAKIEAHIVATKMALLNPGTILVRSENAYDDSRGEPIIEFFQVIKRDGKRVTVAGLRKECLHEDEPGEAIKGRRVRPVPDAFVRSCKVCDTEFGRRRKPVWVIRWARSNAKRGTGEIHDETSPKFAHAFADYIPTAATKNVCAWDSDQSVHIYLDRDLLSIYNPPARALPPGLCQVSSARSIATQPAIETIEYSEIA
jgi:hypothetical protein